MFPEFAPLNPGRKYLDMRGWEADERPEPRSLGLLPSGPDPVGEWLAHRQPPGPYIGRGGGESNMALFFILPAWRGTTRRDASTLRQLPPGIIVVEPSGLKHGLIAAEALAPGVLQVTAQPCQRRGEVIFPRTGA